MKPAIKLHHAYFLLACFAASPALAQASALVMDKLSIAAPAGANTDNKANDRIARGPRTDDTRNCDTRGAHSGNGSASASVSTSPGDSSAGGGSAAPRTGFFGCEADRDRSTR